MVGADRKRSRRARSAIGAGRNECFVSVATAWEIAIKVSLGSLRVEASLERFLPEQVAANGFQPLPIDLRHTARVATLPFRHRDPFDRLLVAQALEEELAVVNADPAHQADPQVQCAVRQPPVRHDPGHAGDLTNEAVQEPGRRGRAVRHVETSRPPRTRRRRGRRRRRGGP